MSARFLLDTNICIYALSERYPKLLDRFDALSPGEAVISVVVLGELRYGIAKSQRKHAAQLRLAALERVVSIEPLPAEAGVRYGAIRAFLESRGTPIGANDLWIAAHALAAELILVTHNLSEFARVPQLRLEDWV